MKGKKCFSQKLVYLLLLFVLPFLCSVFILTEKASAASLSINSFDFHVANDNIHGFSWVNGKSFNDPIYPYEVNAYRFNTNSITATGNFARIHFETNIVFSQATNSPYWARFINLDELTVQSCGSSVGSVTIRSQSVSYQVTEWEGVVFNQNSKNQTLTIYGDVVLGGVSSASQYFACSINAVNSFYSVQSVNYPSFFVEQQPTQITFTNDETEALLNTQITQNNTIIEQNNQIIDALNNQDDNQQDKYEAQSEDVQDDIDDANSASVSQGNTLISILTTFFDLVRTTPNSGSGCVIPLYFKLTPTYIRNYNVNLCQQGYKTFMNTSIPNYGISTFNNISLWSLIATVTFGVIIIRLVISVLHVMKRIYEEFRK